jgi:hypothetical protein
MLSKLDDIIDIINDGEEALRQYEVAYALSLVERGNARLEQIREEVRIQETLCLSQTMP